MIYMILLLNYCMNALLFVLKQILILHFHKKQ